MSLSPRVENLKEKKVIKVSYLNQESCQCFVGFLCVWTFYVCEYFTDPYLDRILVNMLQHVWILAFQPKVISQRPSGDTGGGWNLGAGQFSSSIFLSVTQLATNPSSNFPWTAWETKLGMTTFFLCVQGSTANYWLLFMLIFSTVNCRQVKDSSLAWQLSFCVQCQLFTLDFSLNSFSNLLLTRTIADGKWRVEGYKLVLMAFFLYLQLTISALESNILSLSPDTSPLGWGYRIHRLHLYRGVRPSQQVSWIWY